MDQIDIQAIEQWYSSLLKESKSLFLQEVIVGLIGCIALLTMQFTTFAVLLVIYTNLSRARKSCNEKAMLVLLFTKYSQRLITPKSS